MPRKRTPHIVGAHYRLKDEVRVTFHLPQSSLVLQRLYAMRMLVIVLVGQASAIPAKGYRLSEDTTNLMKNSTPSKPG